MANNLILDGSLLDLGLDVTELVRDSPKVSFQIPTRSNLDHITDEIAKKAGRCLNQNKCISLVFLLKIPNAYNFCKEIENGNLEKTLLARPEKFTIGQSLMLSLKKVIEADHARGWEVKILCALHILQLYRPLIILDPNFGPGGSDMAKKKFQNVESFFIDLRRIKFYKICHVLTSDKAKFVMSKMNLKDDWKRMETAVLSCLKEKKMSDDRLLLVINKQLEDNFQRDNQVANVWKECSIQEMRRETLIKTDQGILLEKGGRCLIINNENFSKHAKRYGSQDDKLALAETFRKFGCRVECQNDLPGDALQSEMKKFSQSIKPGRDKFIIVCILSHGWLNPDTRFDEIVGVDGNCVSTDELTNIVIDGEQCPGGRGIPKLFLIQACRGDEDLKTLPQMQPNDEDSGIDTDAGGHHKIPMLVASKSWYMVFYSTQKGHTSFRHKIVGTFFIQAFCKFLEDYGHCYSIQEIMTMTIDKVQRLRTPEGKSQVPLLSGSFPKAIFLNKF